MAEHFTMTLREQSVQVCAKLEMAPGQMGISIDLSDSTGAPLDWTLTRAELATVCRAAGRAAIARLNKATTQ